MMYKRQNSVKNQKEIFQRFFLRNLPFGAQRVNVMGSLYEVQQGDAEEFLRKWEMTCAVLAAKKLRFDSQTPGEFDVNLIPFSELRKRNIQFDIRAVHSIDNLEISEANAQAFQDLEFLGVNTKREWLSLTSKWDIVQEQHLNLQKSSKNLLFLTFQWVRESDWDFLLIFFTLIRVGKSRVFPSSYPLFYHAKKSYS